MLDQLDLSSITDEGTRELVVRLLNLIETLSADLGAAQTEIQCMRSASLPSDAQFKGYEEVVVQDVLVHTDNVLFRKEMFYSPSQRNTYLAELPPGYHGEFGPGIRAMAIIFAFACQMTEPKILEWFRQVGVQISNLLIQTSTSSTPGRTRCTKLG